MKYNFLSLIIVSLLCGLIFRFEIEYHGWKGLIWLSYFHFAIPIITITFLFWINFFVDLKIRKRIIFNILSLLYVFLILYGLQLSLMYIHSRLIIFSSKPAWIVQLIQFSILIIIPFLPIGTYLILKLFKQESKISRLLVSVVSVCLSIPVSMFILYIINHKGGYDVLHIIKSGVLIPFWIFSIGILFLGINKK